MRVYIPTHSDKQWFREAAQPAVLEDLRAILGTELVEDFLREVQLAEVRAGW
jgi:hypothetical protein